MFNHEQWHASKVKWLFWDDGIIDGVMVWARILKYIKTCPSMEDGLLVLYIDLGHLGVLCCGDHLVIRWN